MEYNLQRTIILHYIKLIKKRGFSMLRVYLLDRSNSGSLEALLVDTEDKNEIKVYWCTGTENYGQITNRKVFPIRCRHPASRTSNRNYELHIDDGNAYETVVDQSPNIGSGMVRTGAKIFIPTEEGRPATIQTFSQGGGLLGSYINRNAEYLGSLPKQEITRVRESQATREQRERAAQDESSPLLSDQQKSVNHQPDLSRQSIIEQVFAMAEKFENGCYWNGKAKAEKLRDAVKTIDQSDNAQQAYDKVKDALSWQRWFTWFQGDSRKAPKNTLQVMIDQGCSDPRKGMK